MKLHVRHRGLHFALEKDPDTQHTTNRNCFCSLMNCTIESRLEYLVWPLKQAESHKKRLNEGKRPRYNMKASHLHLVTLPPGADSAFNLESHEYKKLHQRLHSMLNYGKSSDM